eukprot:scaffold25288_cov112-Isochrysis_galbana.AAC.3
MMTDPHRPTTTYDTEAREPDAPDSRSDRRQTPRTSPRPYRRRAFRQGTLRQCCGWTCTGASPARSSHLALEVAARVAALHRILASDPGASPVESDKGRAQLHDYTRPRVGRCLWTWTRADPYTAPSNGADRVPETHRHSPDSGQCQAPPSNLTAALPGSGSAESGTLRGGALCAPPMWTWPLSVGVLVVSSLCVFCMRERERECVRLLALYLYK